MKTVRSSGQSVSMKRRGIGLARNLIIAAAVLSVACNAGGDDSPTSRVINNVTARFTVNTPTVRFGEKFKVTAYFKNNSSAPVVFRFVPPIFDAQIWRGGVEEVPCNSPEMPYTEVVLKPGKEHRVKDELQLTRECHKPGRHEIRFYYSLSLLPDQKLAEEYKQKYPVAHGAIAWEERGHPFTITE